MNDFRWKSMLLILKINVNMRKIASLLTMLMLVSALAFAQTRTVSGQIKDEKGDPVPFASVVEAGNPSNGTKADGVGYFTIKIKEGSKLTITAQGYKSVTITPTSGVQIISMVTDVTVEKEVVVTTAFNIKKSARTTPFSTQVINNEALNIIPSNNLNAALAGKVAGVQYRGQSSMKLDDQGFLRIRGGLSLGDVGAVYVVDGTIVNSFDLNPDDIENLNILKGANATALFGEQAKNGAIVITTRKRGQAGTAGIEFSHGITIDKAYLFPQYQNTYGGGTDYEFHKFEWKSYMPIEWKALDGKYFPDYTDDSSWGPRLSGQEYIPWYAWYPGSKYSYRTAKWIAQPNNARDFWNTGVTANTNVSFSKNGQGYSTRVSYTNNLIMGMLPNSSSERHTLFATASLDLNEHFSAGANVNFVNTKIKGEFDDAYANQSSGSFSSWFHRDIDMGLMKELRGLRSPLGTYASWNLSTNPDGYNPNNPGKFYKGNYWYNFFTYFDNVDNRTVRDRLYGDVFLKYTINKNFSMRATIRKNQLNTSYENITRSILEASATQTGLFASYGTGQTRSDIMNYEFIANYTNKFLGNLDVNATVGANWNRTKYQDVTMSTRNGLNVPDLYAITNSKDPIVYGNTRQRSEVRSLFASGDFEWKKFASLTWAVRNDWYSTLASGSNSLLSPQIGAGFIFSEFTKESLPWLSFGKVYGSWGKKPTSIGVYASNFLYGVGANQWNGNILMSTPDQLVDPNLKGSLVTTYEFGFDLKFLKNRYGITANYYIEDNNGEPLAVAISGVAGFTSKLINAARIKRQGFEIVVTASPLKNIKNFSWDITKTFGYIVKNPVVKLSEGQTRILLAGGAFGTRFARAFQELGMDWGQLIGGGIKRNDAGLPLLTTGGLYVRDADKHWGSVIPKVTGGLVNSFAYKNWNLNFSIDYQFGGKFFSLSENWGNYSGLLAPTAAINDKGMNVRDDVSDGGGVHVTGVAAADGKTPVDMYVDARNYFSQFYNNQIAEPYVHSLSFIKLRQVALGYNIPVQKMKIGKVFKGATISVVSGNTWLIYRETRSFDPSEISGVQGEDGQLPGTRSIGASLKLRF
jgi:TonB-linked SusC/RagA family outer membrane protein